MLADAELTEPERLLVLAASNGELVDLRTGEAHLDRPSQGGTWDAARTVRAGLLTELLTGRRQAEAGPVRAVKLRGARIIGVLDLEATRLACPLLLDGCFVDQAVNLKDAQAETIRMPGSHVPGIAAAQLRTEGSLELNDGFTASAQICLLGAHIGGQLDLSGASATSSSGPALDADGLTVTLSMFCRHGFTAHGEIRLRTAQIGGQLNLIEASLTSPSGRVLAALGLTVGQDMFCGGLSTAGGEIRMTGARIGGQLEFSGASLTNPAGYVLAARGLTVGQDITFTDGFTAEGQIELRDSRIGGRLDFNGASLANPGGQAVSLEGASAAVLFLLPRTRPDGVVDLTNARVGSFYDDQASWPAAMRLRGFAYDKLENDAISVTDRLDWLERDKSGTHLGSTTSWRERTGGPAVSRPLAGPAWPRNWRAAANSPGQAKHGTGCCMSRWVTATGTGWQECGWACYSCWAASFSPAPTPLTCTGPRR